MRQDRLVVLVWASRILDEPHTAEQDNDSERRNADESELFINVV